MEEFNPFDRLGIDPSQGRERRETQYDNSWSPFDGGEKFNVDPGNQPDFVMNGNNNKLDWEVKSQLGIDLDTSLENNQQAAQAYVDALSKDDYKTWRKLRDEGYSISATKALMENQDLLYDVNQEGMNKYLSTNRGTIRNLYNSLLQTAGEANRIYEDVIHPWTDEMKYNLDQKTMDIINETSREDEYLKYLGTGFTSENMPSNSQMYLASVDANIKMQLQGIKALLPQIAKAGPAVIDFITNFGTQLGSLINPSSEKAALYGYDVATIDPSKRSTIRGSYESLVNSVFLPAFIAKYPSASLVLTELAATSPSVEEIMEKLMSGTENFYRWLLEKTHVDQYFFEGLNEQEQQEAINNLAQGTWIVATAIAEGLKTKVKNSEPVKNFERALKVSNEFSKKYTQSEMNKVGKSRNEALKGQEVGTELLDEKGRPLATQTEEGVKPTVGGMVNLGKTKLGKRIQGFKNSMEWYYKYLKDKSWLVDRDPNAPVGELPVPAVTGGEKPIENITDEKPTEEPPKEETPIEDTPIEKGTPKKGTPITTVTSKPDGEGLSSFIKRVSNDLAGTEGGLDKTLVEKLKSSPELQNEYMNTIDPYIRANGAENPGGVIKEQLADFVDTVKNQLETRKIYNMDFRKGQKQYGVQVSQAERIQQKLDDLKINNLLKILKKSQEDPEKYLSYLLNLPEKTINEFNELIPDFSVNLNFIKDTLDITRAITKGDLLDKFLSFKSGFGGRNKGFLKRMLYKKLAEIYKEQGIKFNLKQIENMLNNMSEEEIIQLEKEANGVQELGEAEGYDAFTSKEQSLLDRGLVPMSKVYQTLVNQGYISHDKVTKYSAHGVDDLMNLKLKRGGTVKDWIDALGLSVKEAYGLNPKVGTKAGIDSLLRSIYLYQTPENLPELALSHEILHDLQNKLTTKEYFDFMEGLSKSTKGLRKYRNYEKPSEYQSLEKSELATLEYEADLGGLLLTYGSIRGLSDFLQANLSKSLGNKVKSILNETGKRIWNNFSTALVDGKEWVPEEELGKLLDKADNPEFAQKSGASPIKEVSMEGYKARLDYLKKVDKNLKDFHIEYKDKSKLGNLVMEMKDGTKLSWEEYKKTLSPEQIEKLQNENLVIEGKGNTQEFRGDGKYDEFKNILRDIEPDIVGVKEKDGKLYAIVKQESYRERWEMASGPGMVEIHDYPLEEFVKEVNGKIPEDLQKLIKKYAN